MKQAWRNRLLLVVAGGIVLVPAGHWLTTRGTAAKIDVTAADCAAWDRSASMRIATLVLDDSAAGDLRLDEAVAQLRRARKYCRSGLISVASGDYQAIERAIPVETTASIPNGRR